MIIDPQTLSLFFAAAILLALAPGPDNIFVLTQSAMSGRAAGFWVTLGLCTGLIVHTLAVAIGVAAVIATSALAFSVLKYAGAAYLLYLAWQAWTANKTNFPGGTDESPNAGQLYRRGVLMNVMNPKVAIFFLAFLPQFIDPAKGQIPLQVFLLGLTFMVATLIVFGAAAWGAGGLGNWLRRSSRVQTILNRVAALVFAGLALKLLTAKQ